MQLHVVGTGIFQRHPAAQRFALNAQRGQRGILELTEAPLEGMGNKLKLGRSDDLVGFRRERQSHVEFFVRKQPLAANQFVVQPARNQPIIMRCVRPGDLPMDHALPRKDEPAGIAKRTRHPCRRGHEHILVSFGEVELESNEKLMVARSVISQANAAVKPPCGARRISASPGGHRQRAR